jgi:hypothetical protein
MLRICSVTAISAITFSFILSSSEVVFCQAFSLIHSHLNEKTVYTTGYIHRRSAAECLNFSTVAGRSRQNVVRMSRLSMSLSETETAKEDSSPDVLQKDKNGIYDLQGKTDHV